MLEQIGLRNFKAAQDICVRVAPMTLLTGLNSSGKSTVLQALALLRQSTVYECISDIVLYGELVQLGSATDVLTDGAESDSISVSLVVDGESWRCSFSADSTGAVAAVESSPWLPAMFLDDSFHFVQADRIAPKTMFSRSHTNSPLAGPFGGRGEYAIQYLASQQAADAEVSSIRRFDGSHQAPLFDKVAPTNRLIDQVSGWLQLLSPGVRVGVDSILGTDEYRLLYDYVGRSGVSESDKKLRPSNVGFGLTYSLPIVVACLAAQPGSILLIENPEAHLHPQGQAAMAQLISRAVCDGVQVVVETHSDHFLNGLRLAVKNGLLASDKVAVHYFSRDVLTGFVDVQSPAILENGRMSGWPKGFFDQWDNAIDQLLSD